MQNYMASELVEITMGGFIPEKCHNAEYKGFIAQDVVLKAEGEEHTYAGGSRWVTYCQPVNATMINELMDKVNTAAKAIGANLVCGGTIERHDDPDYGLKSSKNSRDSCYVYFYGP